MGPFQGYQEHKALEKEGGRSRIPRLILRPYCPKQKGLPMSDSPFSEEEGRDCDFSYDHSKRTISTNSYSSGSEKSRRGSPKLGERKVKVKRVRVDVMAEWSVPPSRHKREQRSSKQLKGSDVDFSSSSSSRGSVKSREARPASPGGKKVLLSQRHSRRSSTGQYHSCGDNHGIKPPNPEQYLTPLQQKEVTIRHLRSKLKQSETRVCERELEVEELKAQLGRMREDWIEEECHRVEAQLALKEARKEIKQLRQVVETMKNSLMEKDKGIQKYFIDINIQNKKLESLLHSMEMAQNGSMQDESALDLLCDSPPGKTLAELGDGPALEDQAAEKMADSSLLADDEMANRTDILEYVLMSTAVDSSQNYGLKTDAGQSGLLQSLDVVPVLPTSVTTVEQQVTTEDKAIQTDFIPDTSDLKALLLQLLHLQSAQMPTVAKFPALQSLDTPEEADQAPSDPPPTTPPTPEESSESGELGSGPEEGPCATEDQDVDKPTGQTGTEPCMAIVQKHYWSNSFLVDLAAVAVPMLPTVAWFFSTHSARRMPVYNIGSMIRGCCVVGLHSLRQVSLGPNA
ncbi:hypothetical protein AGOR_G00204440 [Albula goreensis]|uniref:Syntabulin n=1 Tax=Albula goreensis TaxID=1534307 RepID=A0A8T3CS43_9TELE|nr:hypothetical protein AGOR_G00204440 [Albula goreensis]